MASDSDKGRATNCYRKKANESPSIQERSKDINIKTIELMERSDRKSSNGRKDVDEPAPLPKDLKYLQDGIWNPRYKCSKDEAGREKRRRSNTITTAGDVTRPPTRPRRTMSVSCKGPPPTPAPRALKSAGMELVYSTPWQSAETPPRRRNSVSSSTSSLSSASGGSSPSSPTVRLNTEQFWGKYKRTVQPPSSLRNLFASLALSESSDHEEPVYAEIYGSRASQSEVHVAQPPLPRRNSVSKPPARPPYPASSIRSKS